MRACVRMAGNNLSGSERLELSVNVMGSSVPVTRAPIEIIARIEREFDDPRARAISRTRWPYLLYGARDVSDLFEISTKLRARDRVL